MTSDSTTRSASGAPARSSTHFVVDQPYTRAEIYELLAVPAEQRRGNWDTGYNRFGDDWFIFANVGAPGRTGHDYDNRWLGDALLWRGKGGSRLDQPAIQSLLEPAGETLVFWREEDRAPFWFAGVAVAMIVEDTSPVTVTWEFPGRRGAAADGLERLVATRPSARARGQGFASDPGLRRAVEDHAMRMASDHFRAAGYVVDDVHTRQPYDLACRRGSEVLHVEVKGTTTSGDEVLLTPGEVAFARTHAMALFVVHGITALREGDTCRASAGSVHLVCPWTIDEGRLHPIGYTYAVPQRRG